MTINIERVERFADSEYRWQYRISHPRTLRLAHAGTVHGKPAVDYTQNRTGDARGCGFYFCYSLQTAIRAGAHWVEAGIPKRKQAKTR